MQDIPADPSDNAPDSTDDETQVAEISFMTTRSQRAAVAYLGALREGLTREEAKKVADDVFYGRQQRPNR